MKKFFFSLLLMLALFNPCYAYERNTIMEIRADGEILVMMDGSVYRVDDPVTTSIWLPPCDVIITNNDKIINLDENDEDVYILERLR